MAHAPKAETEFAPERIGRYRIRTKLGQGGMGEVYLATHPTLNVDVAIKTIRSDLAADSYLRKKFLQEGQKQARLNHPNILTVHDSDQTDQSLFLVQEVANGGSLRDALQARKIKPKEAVSIARKLASALVHAHGLAEPVIHLDIKPENVLFVNGEPKLSDFGIARILGDSSGTGTRISLDPRYCAPEQFQNLPSERSDIYSLGLVLWEMLLGHQPDHISVKSDEDRQRVINSLPSNLASVGALLAACLSHEPTDRPSAAELVSKLEDLERLWSRPPSRGTRDDQSDLLEMIRLPRFSQDVEARFRKEDALLVQRIVRVSIPVGILEYLVFLFWDMAQPDLPVLQAFGIRFGFVLIGAFTLLLTFTRLFVLYAQQILFFMTTAGVLGVAAILSLSKDGFVHGVAGIGAVVMFACTLGCLRFRWSAAFSLVTIAACNVLIVTSSHNQPLGYVLQNSNAFLLAYCSLGMIFSYVLEHSYRTRFRNTGVLSDWIQPKPIEKSLKERQASVYRVFICYRRNESADIAGRIQDRLDDLLPDTQFIKDVDVVAVGSDYRSFLGRVIKGCDLMLAIIGPHWLHDSRHSESLRPSDPIRAEIELAFNLGIPVVPILVQGAVMPAKTELPSSLERFSYLNAAHVRQDPDFRADLERLADTISALLSGERENELTLIRQGV